MLLGSSTASALLHHLISLHPSVVYFLMPCIGILFPLHAALKQSQLKCDNLMNSEKTTALDISSRQAIDGRRHLAADRNPRIRCFADTNTKELPGEL
jgi:hypothetical protein